MSLNLPLLQALIENFKKLPGVGEKTARRMTFSVLEMDKGEVEEFAEALLQVKRRIGFCNRCGNLAEGDLCPICQDPTRTDEIICVVERPSDVFIFEESGGFRGRYHVLHGVISPLDNVGPEDINLGSLEKRVEEGKVREVIIATNPSIEGDTTSLYIARILKPYDVKVTRLARGIPIGTSLEYIDGETLSRAIDRREPI
ncbi:MAG: recombination protein RecR [Candidatus Latescibacteria bacterium 4484_7]|nr:MAG: recombination protein RecR [Candidatus Latescibacteria bacterium 4484_7]